MNRSLLPLLALAGVLTAAAARAEDVAIVAGIGDYVNLPDAHLDGIDNDVNGMDAVLKRAGFQTIRLFNATASEQGIRAAFASAAQRVHNGDRFVYFQSSHGSRSFHLLTYDTTTSGEHVFSKDDIQALMSQIHTRRKSLILDACFSGGFKERGEGYHRNKFYPIATLTDSARQGIRDRNDTVIRTLAVTAPDAAGKRDFVVFASSQDNQTSQVVQINGTICSAFTHFLVEQLNTNRTAPWNTIVQPTIAGVLRETSNQQSPVFDASYLPYLVYTTDQRAGDASGATTVPVRNLGQLYDINNTDTDLLALSAKAENGGHEPDEIYHPGTRMRMRLRVQTPGYLFMINRDDEDMAQMVGWGQEDLDLTNLDKMIDQSYVSKPDEFEFGKGSLTIKTSPRSGIEHWKAFLFTSREDALTFARLWTNLTAGTNKRVRMNSFAGAKLDTVARIGVSAADGARALYTSEVHYRVSDK